MAEETKHIKIGAGKKVHSAKLTNKCIWFTDCHLLVDDKPHYMHVVTEPVTCKTCIKKGVE